MEDQTIAVFLDFENLAVSAERAYPSKEKPLTLAPIIDYVNTLGNVLIKRAYANWSRPIFYQYQKDLVNNGFELIHLPETTSQGKNGSDVKLAIDLMENMELYGTISTYIVGSGDSDFIPLIQSIRKRGKRVVVLGFNSSVGHIVKKVCNDYRSIESFLGRPEEDLSMEDDPEMARKEARNLLIRYSKNLEEEELGVLLSKLKMDLKRMDPSFSESKCGFGSFKEFIGSYEGDLLTVKEDPSNKGSLIAYFIERTGEGHEVKDMKKEASLLLTRWGYVENRKKREFIASRLMDVMKENDHISINDMVDRIYDGRKKIAKKRINKFLLTLFYEGAFVSQNDSYQGPLNTRWFRFKRKGLDTGAILAYYQDGVRKILKERFHDLSKDDIEQLLEK